MKTLDITPKWIEILGVLIILLQDGSAEGKKVAKEELARMAKAADLYNAEHKGS